MVAGRIVCGLLCAAGGVGALELHDVKPSRGISVHKEPKAQPPRDLPAGEQVSLRAVDAEPPAPRMRKAWTPTYMKVPDGTWMPVKIAGYGSKAWTYNVIVTPPGFAQYEVPDVDKHLLRKVEEYDEVIPERAPKKIEAATKKAGKDHYVRMAVKDAEGKQILEAKMLSRSPMRALQHMACDKLKLGKWSCEMDTALLTSTGSQVNAADTPDTLQLAEGAEFTVARHTAELHGKYAHKDFKQELQNQLAAEEAAKQEAAKQEAAAPEAAEPAGSEQKAQEAA